jgi:hypothetical protein
MSSKISKTKKSKTKKSKTKKSKTKKLKTKKSTNKKSKSNNIKSIKEETNKDLTIHSLINGKTKQLTNIIYNKKPYGYFYLGGKILEYIGERKLKIDFDNPDPNYELWNKKCITINFHKETEDEGAYLSNFFHSKKNELCLTKKNIKPADMFPLFDIFIQEFKLNKLKLIDASTLHLKYCNYNLNLLGLLEKNYTYYNKFGFIPILPKNKKTTLVSTKTTLSTSSKSSKNIKNTKKVPKEDFNKPLKLTLITKNIKKISKSVKDIQTIKINYLLHILEYYHIDFSNYYSFTKTKDIKFDNLSEQLKYRIKEIINIYNKENSNHNYKYSYNKILNLNIKEFISEFILFFCNYKKNNIKYIEKVNYITNIITQFIYTFNRKSINKVNYYNKLYYYGKDGINNMTGFDIENKKFIIKQCPKYEISINKNTKTNIVEIIINDI